MDRIGDVMKQSKGRSSLMKSVRAAMVVEFFNDVIKNIWGDVILDQAKGLSLKYQVLTVACLNSIICHEIKLREQEFIVGINRKFGPQTVIKVKYML